MISNQTRAARSFDFEITHMISDQIALHSVQLPLYIMGKEGTPIVELVTNIYEVDSESNSRSAYILGVGGWDSGNFL